MGSQGSERCTALDSRHSRGNPSWEWHRHGAEAVSSLVSLSLFSLWLCRLLQSLFPFQAFPAFSLGEGSVKKEREQKQTIISCLLSHLFLRQLQLRPGCAHPLEQGFLHGMWKKQEVKQQNNKQHPKKREEEKKCKMKKVTCSRKLPLPEPWCPKIPYPEENTSTVVAREENFTP